MELLYLGLNSTFLGCNGGARNAAFNCDATLIPPSTTKDMPRPGWGKLLALMPLPLCTNPLLTQPRCLWVMCAVCEGVWRGGAHPSLVQWCMERKCVCVCVCLVHANLYQRSDIKGTLPSHILYKRSGGLHVRLWILQLRRASLTVSTMPRTWVINRKECVLCFHTTPPTPPTPGNPRLRADWNTQASHFLLHRLWSTH